MSWMGRPGPGVDRRLFWIPLDFSFMKAARRDRFWAPSRRAGRAVAQVTPREGNLALGRLSGAGCAGKHQGRFRWPTCPAFLAALEHDPERRSGAPPGAGLRRLAQASPGCSHHAVCPGPARSWRGEGARPDIVVQLIDAEALGGDAGISIRPGRSTAREGHGARRPSCSTCPGGGARVFAEVEKASGPTITHGPRKRSDEASTIQRSRPSNWKKFAENVRSKEAKRVDRSQPWRPGCNVVGGRGPTCGSSRGASGSEQFTWRKGAREIEIRKNTPRAAFHLARASLRARRGAGSISRGLPRGARGGPAADDPRRRSPRLARAWAERFARRAGPGEPGAGRGGRSSAPLVPRSGASRRRWLAWFADAQNHGGRELGPAA